MEFAVNRPEKQHIDCVKAFISTLSPQYIQSLQQTFGNFSIEDLLQKCSFSSVYEKTVDYDGSVYGFLAMQMESNEDPTTYRLCLFAADELVEMAYLRQTLQIACDTIPTLKRLQLWVPCGPNGSADTLESTNPIVSILLKFGFKILKSDGNNVLLVVERRIMQLELFVRPASIEDIDGVRNLLKQSDLAKVLKTDYDFAAFVDPAAANLDTVDVSKAFVAHHNQTLIGFMKCTNEIEVEMLMQQFYLDEFVLAPEDEARKSEIHARRNNRLKNRALQKSIEHIPSKDHVEVNQNISALSMASLDDDPNHREQAAQEQKISETPPEIKPSIVNSDEIIQITLFCIEPEFAGQSHQLMKACYSSFPTHRHCIVVVPNKSREIPLLANFTLVSPKIMNRNSLYISSKITSIPLTIRRNIQPAHMVIAYDLIRNLPEEQLIIKKLQTGTSDNVKPEQCRFYSILAHTKLIGFVELSDGQEEHTNQYAWESQLLLTSPQYMRFQSQQIVTFIMDPTFSHQTRFIFESLMRLVGCTVLYALFPNNIYPNTLKRSLYHYLVPIKPHKRVFYPNDMRDSQTIKMPSPVSMYAIAGDMIYEPRIRQNARIVIVGASTVGYGLIEQLMFNPNVCFTNIIVLDNKEFNDHPDEYQPINEFPPSNGSNANLPGAVNSSKSNGMEAFVDEISFWPHEFEQLGLLSSVMLKQGIMKKINRAHKFIVTDKDHLIIYDYLIVTTGLQYNTEAISAAVGQLKNVMGVNASDSQKLLEFVDYAIHHNFQTPDQGENVMFVVYGWNLQSLNLIWYLTKRGLSGKKICIVKTKFTVDDKPMMITENNVIDEQIVKSLKELEISVIEGDIKAWEHDDTRLNQIVINGKVIEVAFFFHCHVRTPATPNLDAFNTCSLVFDNRLVIDGNYQTSDKYIYAAGSITRYASRYKTRFNHEYYESRDVGNELGNSLLKRFFDQMSFDQSAFEESTVKDERTDNLPVLRACKRFYVRLPGDWEVFRFDKPHIHHDNAFERNKMGHKVHGRILETRVDQAYCCIHIMPITGKIRSFTMMTRINKHDAFWAPSNFISLYDLNQAYCNNMLDRYQDKMIDDFLTFFNGKWAYVVFDYRFKEQMKALMMRLTVDISSVHKMPAEDIKAVVDELKRVSNSEMSEDQGKEAVYRVFDNLKSRKAMVDSIVWNELKPYIPGYPSKSAREGEYGQ